MQLNTKISSHGGSVTSRHQPWGGYNVAPVNMLDLICIRYGSAWKLWTEAGQVILIHWLASRPDPQGKTLTQSARTKSDLGWFCTIWSGSLWKNGTESKSGKLVVGQLHLARNWGWWFMPTGLLPDQMCLAKHWPGHPDWTWVGFAQYDPCLWKKRTASDAGSWIRHIYDPTQFQLDAGHNQKDCRLDPAHFLGCYLGTVDCSGGWPGTTWSRRPATQTCPAGSLDCCPRCRWPGSGPAQIPGSWLAEPGCQDTGAWTLGINEASNSDSEKEQNKSENVPTK